jgi:hypothetical protein
MMHNRTTMSLSSGARLLERLRLGGKKSAVACALIVIMLFMWIRVYLGQRPAPAAASPAPAPTPAVVRRLPREVKLLELPKSPGRHDFLPRDFFTMKNPSDFRPQAGRNTGTDQEVPVVSPNETQEVIARIAKTLKLEAVLRSERPQVFINDRLLNVGDRLTVKEGAAFYEFEVLRIDVESVLVQCRGIQLTLQLAQYLEVVP